MSRWGSAAWRAEAQRWAFETLDSLGIDHEDVMLDLSIQAWSMVWRMPAASGDVVLKQLQPRDTKEIPSSPVLCRRCAEICRISARVGPG